MSLELNNEIETRSKTNKEVDNFIGELNNALKKEELFDTVIANKIYNENPLAKKYKEHLEEIIEKCFENMSYEKDFCYFDYDKENKVYYLDEYNKGEIERTEYSEKEYKKLNMELGSFWRPYKNNTRIVEAKYMGEGIALDVDLELSRVDNKKKKESKNEL